MQRDAIHDMLGERSVLRGSARSDSKGLPTVSIEWAGQETVGTERPGRRWGHTAVVLPDSGDILLIGGSEQFLSASADVWRFAVKERWWTCIKTVSCPALSAHTASVVTNSAGQIKVVCFGGDGVASFLSSPHVLDPATWTWSSPGTTSVGDPVPVWRRTHAAVALCHEVWIIAGACTNGFLDDIWSFDASERGKERWVRVDDHTLGQCFSPRASHSATLVGDNRIFVFGGYDGTQLGDLWVINVSSRPPSCRPVHGAGAVPSPRSGHAAVGVLPTSPYILFIGGERVTGVEFYDDILIFDTERLQWAAVDIVVSTQWTPRGWCSASCSFAAPTAIFVFGGGSYDSFLDDLSVVELESLEIPSSESSGLGNDLGALLLSERHTDVALASVDGARVCAHRAILAARSPVFRAMLESGVWAEASEPVLHINCSEVTLRAFLGFLYTGRCAGMVLTLPVALDLLELSAQHMLQPLVQVCGVMLARELRRIRHAGKTVERSLITDCLRAAEVHEDALASCVLRNEASRAVGPVEGEDMDGIARKDGSNTVLEIMAPGLSQGGMEEST
eukprot:TRINITY_DN55988_c0_g1_i1.p1 TRINITY_DN55988_c0_g1~~TRINITY_DN55988_c0_g1_i1.p1  ORF type:complete len:563 (-),score=65.39 TRINITY_DN55988_c0_g1_i1:135-1823(-)